jgi:hypothetical protein
MSSVAPDGHVSGVKPHSHQVLQGVFCIAALACAIWVVVAVCVCLVLSATNTPLVHAVCPGLWDFVLASLLFSLLSPFVLLMAPSALTLACPAIFTLLGLLLSLRGSLEATCIEALRDATPPVPWLLVLAWTKTTLHLAALLSSLRSFFRTHSDA